jgi:hypothetical protein
MAQKRRTTLTQWEHRGINEGGHYLIVRSCPLSAQEETRVLTTVLDRETYRNSYLFLGTWAPLPSAPTVDPQPSYVRSNPEFLLVLQNPRLRLKLDEGPNNAEE